MTMENIAKIPSNETKKRIHNILNIVVVIALLLLFIVFAQPIWDTIKTYFSEKEWYYTTLLGENLNQTYQTNYLFADIPSNAIVGIGIASGVVMIFSLILSLIQYVFEIKRKTSSIEIHTKRLSLLSCVFNIASYIFLSIFVILTMGPMYSMLLGKFLEPFISPVIFAKATLILTVLGTSVFCIFLSIRRVFRIVDGKTENAITSILLSWSGILASNVTIAFLVYIAAMLLVLALLLLILYIFIKCLFSFFFGY